MQYNNARHRKLQLITILQIYVPTMAVQPPFSQAPGHLGLIFACGRVRVCMHAPMGVCVCMGACAHVCILLMDEWSLSKGSKYGVWRMHCYNNLQKSRSCPMD